MKLVMLPLKGLEWDKKIPEIEHTRLYEILRTFLKLNNIWMTKCCIPLSEESLFKIRLIGLLDKAEFAGGAVIYAGRKLKSGGWSFSVLA